jgi:hypothetical protein
LPPSLTWPRSETCYLDFLMQVNLAELPPVSDNPLPGRGLLYLFVGEDRGHCDVDSRVVLYGGPTNLLARRNPPPREPSPREETHSFYRDTVPHRLGTTLGVSLPPPARG